MTPLYDIEDAAHYAEYRMITENLADHAIHK
jgi:hypothetical protein